MKVKIRLILDSEYNSLNLPEIEVRDEEEVKAIARKAWTKEQILLGSVGYDNLDKKIFSIPVRIFEEE